jgi:diguanylate cyclase (GGDEF)-like protein
VSEGVATANRDQAAARGRARTGLLLAALALLSTMVMLILVGGLIRRRLGELATAAGRLSSGTLLPMEVRGPREVAIASAGLNDAVTSLREIAAKADLIARGDISSPLLEQPSPGPLGAAMHASFENVVAMVREREAMQQQLAHQAAHDGLTGLANRAETERKLAAAVEQARQSGGLVGLLFIDLDRFKYCNDTYGHQAGDQVLLAVSQRLITELGHAGVAGRLGGDEFVAIVPEVQHHEQLTAIGERIAAAVREPVFYQEHVLHVGASIGMCVWPGDSPSIVAHPGSAAEEGADVADTPGDGARDSEIADWMLSRADDAMYRAKSAGRDTVTF